MKNRSLRPSSRRLALSFAALLVGATLCACSSTPNKEGGGISIPVNNPFHPADNLPGTPRKPGSDRELELKADQLYRQAHKLLVNSEYANASTAFDKVITRFPFTPYATQSELEQIYAQYRNYEIDAAASGADRFLREHPRHPHADYVLYLKGLIDQSRDQSLLRFLPLDTAQFDVSNKQSAFQDFALLLQRYPHSQYNWDARQRMIFLRNRIAVHEIDVARFYTRRGAWLAAAKRAQNVVADYPGAPATADALLLLKRCYAKLGLTALEKQAETLITANARSIQAAKSPIVTTTAASAAPPPMAEVSGPAASEPVTATALKTTPTTRSKAAVLTTTSGRVASD